MRRVFLVTTAPLVDGSVDPGALDVRRLRASGELPTQARWYVEPGTAPAQTAAALTDTQIRVRDGLAGPTPEDREAAARTLLERLPDDDVVLVGSPAMVVDLAAALTGTERDPGLIVRLGAPDVVGIEMATSDRPAPVGGKQIGALTLFFMLGELVAWGVTHERYLGLVTGPAFVVGLLVALSRRRRPWGLAIAAAAALALFLAALGLVAAVRIPVD